MWGCRQVSHVSKVNPRRYGFHTVAVFSSGGVPSNTKSGFMSCSRKVSVRKKTPAMGLQRENQKHVSQNTHSLSVDSEGFVLNSSRLEDGLLWLENLYFTRKISNHIQIKPRLKRVLAETSSSKVDQPQSTSLRTSQPWSTEGSKVSTLFFFLCLLPKINRTVEGFIFYFNYHFEEVNYF